MISARQDYSYSLRIALQFCCTSIGGKMNCIEDCINTSELAKGKVLGYLDISCCGCPVGVPVTFTPSADYPTTYTHAITGYSIRIYFSNFTSTGCDISSYELYADDEVTAMTGWQLYISSDFQVQTLVLPSSLDSVIATYNIKIRVIAGFSENDPSPIHQFFPMTIIVCDYTVTVTTSYPSTLSQVQSVMPGTTTNNFTLPDMTIPCGTITAVEVVTGSSFLNANLLIAQAVLEGTNWMVKPADQALENI